MRASRAEPSTEPATCGCGSAFDTCKNRIVHEFVDAAAERFESATVEKDGEEANHARECDETDGCLPNDVVFGWRRCVLGASQNLNYKGITKKAHRFGGH
jgi:hypothetical protein